MRAPGIPRPGSSADDLRAEWRSPTYVGGVRTTPTAAILEPARLAWGLREACLSLGVRIYEGTAAIGVARRRRGVAVAHAGRRGARRPVVLAPTRSRRCCAGCG